MTRGDQRDRDRAKKQAKLQKETRSQGKEGRPEQRNLNDSAALAAKVAKKAEMKQKQEEEALRASSTTPVVRKKVTTKKEEDLDALLSVGLPGKKK
ncbi:hypothetical protein ACHAXH_008793 [Discostella pseudostelligera]